MSNTIRNEKHNKEGKRHASRVCELCDTGEQDTARNGYQVCDDCAQGIDGARQLVSPVDETPDNETSAAALVVIPADVQPIQPSV
jgi:ribosomal protein L37AE/L43A